MNIKNFILELGEKALASESEYIVPGHNGPYYDPETSIRVIGHWIIIFSRCYELSNDARFKNKAKKLAVSLMKTEARPYGFSFYHRNKTGKDSCNGLIGQAWTFEALAEASNLLGDPAYILLAKDVYKQHAFNYELGLWNRLEIDGRVLSIDDTFNHQLWFAACASLLFKNDHEGLTDIYRFLDCLSENLTILPNGLIYHKIERQLPKEIRSEKTIISKIKKILRPLYINVLSKPKIPADVAKEMMLYKSVGYHSFNMYAFALLKENLPKYPYWYLDDMNKVVSYMHTDEYHLSLKGNKYSYAYNAPGFEIPYALSVLESGSHNDFSTWISTQIKYTYSTTTSLFDKINEDPVTLTARIYELTRLKNLDFEITVGDV